MCCNYSFNLATGTTGVEITSNTNSYFNLGRGKQLFKKYLLLQAYGKTFAEFPLLYIFNSLPITSALFAIASMWVHVSMLLLLFSYCKVREFNQETINCYKLTESSPPHQLCQAYQIIHWKSERICEGKDVSRSNDLYWHVAKPIKYMDTIAIIGGVGITSSFSCIL